MPAATVASEHLVGIVSDTHGLVRPEAIAALAGSELIVHAGDIGGPAVLDALRAVAPVVAVRGNNDRGQWAATLPEREVIDVGGCRLYVLHDAKTLDLDPAGARLRVVIAGHSHRPAVETRRGVLFVNPGSAGPRRFTLPVAVARLRITGGRPRARIIELPVGRA